MLEPKLLDNVVKRIRERGTVLSYFVSGNGWLWVKMGTEAQAMRACQRLDSIVVDGGRACLRCQPPIGRLAWPQPGSGWCLHCSASARIALVLSAATPPGSATATAAAALRRWQPRRLLRRRQLRHLFRRHLRRLGRRRWQPRRSS